MIISVSLDSSSHQPSVEAWPEMMLTAEGTPGDGQWLVRQGGVGPDSVLRQLLGKDMSDTLCPRERMPPAGGLGREGTCGPGASGARRTGMVERRELKLARLKQIMQRSLSESDSDGYPPEEGKNQGASNALRPDRPTHLPITEEEPVSNHLNLIMRKHLPSSSSTAEKKQAFSLSGSKSVDSVGYIPSPSSTDPCPGARLSTLRFEPLAPTVLGSCVCSFICSGNRIWPYSAHFRPPPEKIEVIIPCHILCTSQNGISFQNDVLNSST